jgi:hypothetical protein
LLVIQPGIFNLAQSHGHDSSAMDDHESRLGFRGFKELMVRACQNSERFYLA